MKFGKGHWVKIFREFKDKFNNRSRTHLQLHYKQLEKANKLNSYFEMAEKYIKQNNIKL